MDFNIVEYKKKMITILKGFHEYCIKYNLRYSLSAGSLLGAIRHKGIIPWDDDIDVVMPRPDYDQFIKLTMKKYLSGYEVVSPYNSKGYYLPFAKVIDKNTSIIEYKYCNYQIGAFIDVFPVDGLPLDDILKQKVINEYNRYLNKTKLIAFNYSFSDINKLVGKRDYILSNIYKYLYNSSNYYLKCEEIAKSYNFDESHKVMVFCGSYGEREIINKEFFDSYILVDFENTKVFCVSSYHEYLTCLYGNYMELPPVEKRKSHHSQYFIDLSRRYNDNEIKLLLHKVNNG